jgi:hypothetical protein
MGEKLQAAAAEIQIHTPESLFPGMSAEDCAQFTELSSLLGRYSVSTDYLDWALIEAHVAPHDTYYTLHAEESPHPRIRRGTSPATNAERTGLQAAYNVAQAHTAWRFTTNPRLNEAGITAPNDDFLTYLASDPVYAARKRRHDYNPSHRETFLELQSRVLTVAANRLAGHSRLNLRTPPYTQYYRFGDYVQLPSSNGSE